MAFIYHLLSAPDWEEALMQDSYKPASFEKEKFIHFSSREQVLESASRHFKDEDVLVVLAVSEKKVKQQLKWEASRNGELFPHLYSKLELIWVETSYMISRNKQGEWQWD